MRLSFGQAYCIIFFQVHGTAIYFHNSSEHVFRILWMLLKDKHVVLQSMSLSLKRVASNILDLVQQYIPLPGDLSWSI